MVTYGGMKKWIQGEWEVKYKENLSTNTFWLQVKHADRGMLVLSFQF